MRNTLTLLSLLALASAASAQMNSISTSSLIASYTLGSGVSLASYSEGEYTFNTGDDDDGGNATALEDGSTTHSHIDGSALFTMGALTSASLDSVDYGAITPQADPYAEAGRGYRYFLTFSAGAAGGTVTFDFHTVQSLIGSAASPIGLASSDPVSGNFSPGAYASGLANAGVLDTANGGLDTLHSVDTTAHENTTSVPSPTYELLGSRTFSHTFDLAANETHTYEIYASSRSEVDYQAVPEPSALAALGVGALGLLRRRRK